MTYKEAKELQSFIYWLNGRNAGTSYTCACEPNYWGDDNWNVYLYSNEENHCETNDLFLFGRGLTELWRGLNCMVDKYNAGTTKPRYVDALRIW